MDAASAATDAGHWVAGFVAYEAAPAFDPALSVQGQALGPLVWFGVYEQPPVQHNALHAPENSLPQQSWQPCLSREQYGQALRSIRGYLAAGDTYQVNYTFPLEAHFDGDALAWFSALWASQRADHAACINLGDAWILSLSPELFFRLEQGTLELRPMKGTRPRGLWPAQDQKLKEELARCEKERAENVMIVDMLRNDAGRVARVGSVQVDALFALEKYPTVWQMVSRISAETTKDWSACLAALFPSGSVTGAPKVRTMEIIQQLEPFPRGPYCGAIGWAGPDGTAEFNVAIRTIHWDTRTRRAIYSVGSGITWDSSASAEYGECLAKAAVLNRRVPMFDLLETMLWENGAYFLLEEHVARARSSADYFDFHWNEDAVWTHLMEAGRTLQEPTRVRMTISREGTIHITTNSVPAPKRLRVAIANGPVDSGDVFLYHKTTQREIYERHLSQHSHCDDVILFNERGEITESCIGNVFAEFEDGRIVTPPVSCGLLAGAYRNHLLKLGRVQEAVVEKRALLQAKRLWLGNSVRKWIEITLLTNG